MIGLRKNKTLPGLTNNRPILQKNIFSICWIIMMPVLFIGFLYAQDNFPVRTEWHSPDGSPPVGFLQWKQKWDIQSRIMGGEVKYRSRDKDTVPADSFIFGHDYAYFKDYARHSDGSYCEHTPPDVSFFVTLNGNDSIILTDEAPRWSIGDPNISGRGWFGIELGNFRDPSISIGDTFRIVFTCHPPGESPEQGEYAKEIIGLPFVAWPSTLQLFPGPIPTPPENIRLSRENAAVRITWKQLSGKTYTIYRRSESDTLALNFPRYQYHKIAEGISDSLYIDSRIDTSDTYGYVLFATDTASGLMSGRSRDIRETISINNVRAIIVQPELYFAVENNVLRLAADWEQEGANVVVYAMQFPYPQALRDTLRHISGLHGALLIGDFPVPWFQFSNDSGADYQEYPCDLYYMDLDGIWEDNLMKPATGPLVPGSDGIFDTHSANYPRSTERPDIVVGRITPTPGMGNSADIVNYYLDKCHNYRHDLAGIRQNFRALAYPDDDWHQWGNDIANLYMSKVFQEYLSIYDINHTTATDYGARLDDGFSLIHVWVHSWSGGHAFSINNGTQSQYFYNYQILTSHANANFYQLFACGNSRYIQEGNCAAIYALQTTHGINTIGSTHSGGMLEFDYFYIVLSEGLSYGEAFLKTFRHAGEIKFSPEMRGWYYGLTFNGDPYIIPEPSAATSIVQQSDVNIPDSWYIQNYPNPFNSTTQIEYHCPVAGNVKVTIYNALGEIVRNLVDEWQNAGTNKVFWNGMDNNGQAVASGIYYYRLQAGDNHMETKKMLLLR